MGKNLRFGAEHEWGRTQCGFGLDEHLCSNQATRHFMVLNNSFTLQACDEHVRFIRDRNIPGGCDEHDFKDDCGMPGTYWYFPEEDEEEGYCAFPPPDDASAILEEELVGSSTAATPAESHR